MDPGEKRVETSVTPRLYLPKQQTKKHAIGENSLKNCNKDAELYLSTIDGSWQGQG